MNVVKPLSFLSLFALVLAPACSGEPTIETRNSAPTANIDSHQEGSVENEGYTVTFSGSISDTDKADQDSLEAKWSRDGEVICDWIVVSPDGGETSCDIVLPDAGSATITLVGRDQDQATGDDAVTIEVNPTDAPEVTISSPVAGDKYYSDELIELAHLLENKHIVLVHFSQIYSSEQVVEIIDRRLPPAIRQRVHLFTGR